MKRSVVAALYVFSCFLLLLTGLAGCINKADPGNAKEDFTAQNEELKKLFPDKAGYHWIYSGFAEYGHALDLNSVLSEQNGETVYRLSGAVGDPSGGEAKGDFSLSVEYVISKGSLIQKITGEKMMDTFPQMELLRSPLKPETQWEQKVKDRAGKEYELVCTIISVNEDNGNKVYSVRYKDKKSDFYEKRVFKEKTGVIEFEKIWQSKEGPVTMGYALYDEASGYPQKAELKAYLPPLDRELRYFGLAEYGHVGTMTKVSENDREGIYQFNGSFQDGSGIPGEFKIRYTLDYTAGTVREEVLRIRVPGKRVNSKLHDLLCEIPLGCGQYLGAGDTVGRPES